MTSNVQHIDLNELEETYRLWATRGDAEAQKLFLSKITQFEYEARMGNELIFRYTSGLEEPLVMRVVKNDKDLERFLKQRFRLLQD
jgi:hypothetical protein